MDCIERAREKACLLAGNNGDNVALPEKLNIFQNGLRRRPFPIHPLQRIGDRRPVHDIILEHFGGSRTYLLMKLDRVWIELPEALGITQIIKE
jgi:hypothetical protein